MALLMMVSMAAGAQYVTVNIEKDGDFGNGSITEKKDAQTKSADGNTVTVTLIVKPKSGYSIDLSAIEVYETISPQTVYPNGTRTNDVTLGKRLDVKCDVKTITKETACTVDVASNLGVWVKKAEFLSEAKGNRDGVTYKYYAIHNKDNGYLKQVNGAVANDGTFRYEDAHNGNGSSIWVMSSDGYLQQEMYYLNVANDQTLYLSPDKVTQWTIDNTTIIGKNLLKPNGSSKYLCADDGKPQLNASPSNYYNACEMTITATNKWDGPKDVSFTVQSPQLVTYIRTYYIRNITAKINKNDAGTENVAVVSGKDSRCYQMLTYKSGGSNKGTNWDISSDGIIYNKTTSNQKVKATYTLTSLDPIALSAHSVVDKDVELTIQPQPITPDASKNYILYSIKAGDNDRYPYDDGIGTGGIIKPDGKGGTSSSSVLTDPAIEGGNKQISWKVTVDTEGFYYFQNVNTSAYLYFDETPHASSDYGAVKVGATTLPTGAEANKYRFRLYKTSNTDYGTCYQIIPYSKQFAVFKSDGVASGAMVALNNYDYKSKETKVISLYNANGNSQWCIYKYEAEYRVRADFTFSGPTTATATGEYEFTSSDGWYGKYITESPKNGNAQRGLVISGTYNTDKINYIWTIIGLDDYVNHEGWTVRDGGFGVTNVNNKKQKFTVTSLPVSSASGVVQLQLRGGENDKNASTNPYRWSSNKTVAFTIMGDGTVTFTDISSLSQITSSSGAYRLTADVSDLPAVTTFSGILDGGGHTISGLSQPLFTTLTNGTVHDLNLSNVNISQDGQVGAIACMADGGSRIYNVGILSGSVGSTSTATSNDAVGCCGGLIGRLDGSARVINCFSYANITGGNRVGGIVGYNNYATTSSDLRTMVMNCMFYGDITGGTNKAPIYNGKIITNRGDASGVSNFNYFWGGASYVTHRDANNNPDIQTYNCALLAETRFLQRFEFFRHVLNGHRELAAWWATGSADNKELMMKWVLEPSQIGTSTPYPILKAPDRYPSVVNIDVNHSETYKGRDLTVGPKLGNTLSVTIQNSTTDAVYGAPTGANITTTSLSLNIMDKDPDHFNFNYGKVQLPYYNDVGTGNYTQNKVVTGWKIVSVGGVEGEHTFSTGTMPADATATVTGGDITLTTPYNYADRKCTQKDVYETNGHRIFNQGAYWDVPEGVTSITIEPYWAKCVYVADAYPDVVYNKDMGTSYNVTTVGGGQRYEDGKKYNLNNHSIDETNGQIVYTSMSNAIASSGSALFSGVDANNHSVYDYAVVLVGNYHHYYSDSKKIEASNSKPYTVTSIDLDGDNEPDYSYIMRLDKRQKVHPVRIDFLNVIGLGMAQKSYEGTGTYNFGIMQPKNWFECTNTGLFRVTQLEYDQDGRTESPMILHGGVIEQWVAAGQSEHTAKEAKAVSYYHVGGNVWFKEFHIGVHQDKTQDEFWSPHPPISVSGGDYDIFYLTGYYNTPGKNAEDNAECYINGGRFGKVAGTGMQGIGKTGGAGVTGGPTETGNIIWQIDNADIDEFYAGGMNAAHKAEGNIYTVISNSRVDQFCGGPKFGDMNSDKIVVTNAENCIFRTFFGAGYGGNSYNRRYPANQNDKINIDWNSWLTGSAGYDYSYDANYGGVETRIDYQFIPMSGNTTNVARLIVEYVSFSLATTHNVTTKLTDCTITKSHLGRLDISDNDKRLGNFYGGGSLGKVNGPVKSTLTNCIVEGNVFGAGYSASTPTVSVMGQAFQTEPYYNGNLGVYMEAEMPTTTTYNWEHAETVNSTETAINTSTSKLFTTVDLSKSNLGSVSGAVTLTLTTSGNGETIIGTAGNDDTGNVYGGGDESYVYNATTPANASTTVTLQGNTHVLRDVFGGGNRGIVSGSATVNIE